ncbi:MAG: type VII secretion protein EssC [Bacilli bacterium]|nr:type VII secretion protein EssC [Bacilli bacterium]
MKIYLFLPDELYTFNLPSDVSGSFSFDIKEGEEKKLINIEASQGKWMIYSTIFSRLIVNGLEVESQEVIPGNFYKLQREDESYLIKIENSLDDSFGCYKYDTTLNLKIGGPDANLIYNNAIGSYVYMQLSFGQDGKVYVQNNAEINPYINNIVMLEKQFPLEIGDYMNIYGLKIYLLNGLILINNPNGEVVLNEMSSGLVNYYYEDTTERSKEEVVDIDMYKEEDYYSKSPRLRRQIETKDFDIENPPNDEKDSNALPVALTLGPQLIMGLVGVLRLTTVITAIISGERTLGQSILQLLTSIAAVLGSLVWPRLSKAYMKHIRRDKQRELEAKYDEYINHKARELDEECMIQAEILKENLYDEYECLKIMNRRGMNFWDKRMDQNDLLVARIGVGDEELDANINFSTREFDIDKTEMRQKAEEIVEQHKIIKNVPIGYSFNKNKTTAIMGEKKKVYTFVNNILLQFITYYNYTDLKLVVFTDGKGKKNFEYISYLNHNFSNDKSFRYFATDQFSAKNIAENLLEILKARTTPGEDGQVASKIPYYLIIVDGYDLVKRYGLINALVEIDADLGFSLIIIENKLSKLPSKCNNFISIGENLSNVLTNSYDEQKSKTFKDEVKYNINMMEIARVLSNIPIEVRQASGGLPQSETFLEMERVGKVEQLNILERWKNNDATESLRAEVGVDGNKELIYLDLHEKAHGPHGLIAGTTGSGKSEFIITYILSMCINYSPDDISFILIDYKGGGLAYAFENKTNNMILPHLTGTITNLDKSEMDRTLVSIDSEVKRRQKLFNEAREATAESTMDIYKYQKHFHSGELKEPCPHLLIICDEFAELKDQQPDFMDDLISIARIGRSLGVHLILATQKPSGQVSEQIWTNTKFRVCLKVQSPGDSREMLKKPDAAFLKEAGRFYLQVGQDELYILGQSGWAGAKYYPSNTVIKEADKSINIINDTGIIIKNIKAGGGPKVEAQGEQLAAILKNIIEVADQTNKRVKKLWLPSIEGVILLDDIEKKYNVVHEKFKVKGTIGEYDAPEIQQQGLLEINCLENQNTLIYGIVEDEREFFLKTALYSIFTHHDASEVNTFIIDYGSESLRVFESFPQVGEFVGQDDGETVAGVIKLIKNELNERKKNFMQYGGDYNAYLKNSPTKLPIMLLIINGYENFIEINKKFPDILSVLIRECTRYGIFIWITLANTTSISRRQNQSVQTNIALHLKDDMAYRTAVPGRSKLLPRKDFARGIVNNGRVHEFQTASIIAEKDNVNTKIAETGKALSATATVRSKKIPKLPAILTFDMVKDYITDLKEVPIGMEKETLKISKYNFTANNATTISGYKLENINGFMSSLVTIFKTMKGVTTIFIDPKKNLPFAKDYVNNYYDTEIEKTFDVLYDFTEKNKTIENSKIVFIIYGISDLKNILTNVTKVEGMLKNIINNTNMHLIIADGARNLRTIDMDRWYSLIRLNTDGIWVGKGLADTQVFRVTPIPREASLRINDTFGFNIFEQGATVVKLLSFYAKAEEEESEENEEQDSN